MSGMFGIGGGTVRIPLLNLVGLPLLSAFGINLFIAGLILTLILALLFVALSLVIVLGLFLDRIAPVNVPITEPFLVSSEGKLLAIARSSSQSGHT